MFSKVIKYTFILTFLVSGTSLFSQNILFGKDKVVKVNNKIITLDELKKSHEELNNLGIMYGKNFTEKEVLDSMIDEELLKAKIREENIFLDESMLEQELRVMKEQFTALMQSKDPNFVYSDEKFKEYIVKEGNITYEQFKTRIEDKAKVQKFIMGRSQMKIQKVEAKQFSESELKAFRNANLKDFVMPESVTIKHIFFITSDNQGNSLPDSEISIKKQKADDVLKQLKAGESFDKLCLFNTEDTSTRDAKNPMTGELDRGLLGTLPLEKKVLDQVQKQYNLVSNFSDMVIKNSAGYISPVVQGKFGLHIFYIKEKLSERIITLDEARGRITQVLKAQEKQKIVQEEYTNLIKELREKAEIKYYNDEYK